MITLDTLDEARSVLTMSDNNSILRSYTSVRLYIDAVTLSIKTTTEWYWTKTGKKIAYPIPWRPGTPDNSLGNEYCLTIGRYLTTGIFWFDDAQCNDGHVVLCQRIDFLVPQ